MVYEIIYDYNKQVKISKEEKKKEIDKYFEEIRKKVEEIYEIAKKARSIGFDPKDDVEIKLAYNRIERINAIMTTIYKELEDYPLVEEIQKYEEKYGKNDWRVGFKIGKDVAFWLYKELNKPIDKSIELGVRMSLAYLTMGIVIAPIEGIHTIKLKDRLDKEKYLAIYFASPIRAAGGSAAAATILAADYIRREFGIKDYDPTKEEIERYLLEIFEYIKSKTPQYIPLPEELRAIVSKLPIEVTGVPGEGTKGREVPGYRDLPRVETNELREGMILAMVEGLALKAKKIIKKLKKWGDEFKLESWIKILEEAQEIRKKIIEEKEKKRNEEIIEEKTRIPKIPPETKYLDKIVSGRPILSDPLAKGGFRLRYGRARTSGMSAAVIHPATMIILDEFLAIGTQIALERPGKGAIVTTSRYIEGPIVKLKDGSVIRVEDVETAKKIKGIIDKILFLGDLVFPVGEFKQQGHFLTPSPWVEEWYALLLKNLYDNNKIDEKDREFVKKIIYFPWQKIDQEKAIYLSKKYNIPLHPRYTYFWHDINKEQFLYFVEYLFNNSKFENNKLIVKKDSFFKSILEILGIPHKVNKDFYEIEEGLILKEILCLYKKEKLEEFKKIEKEALDVIDMITKVCGIDIKVKSPVYVGVRMGRPEKSKMREIKGKPNILFPVGLQGGKSRDLILAIQKYGYVKAEVPIFYCKNCKRITIYPKCEVCGLKTIPLRKCPKCGKYTQHKICPICKVKTKVVEERKIYPQEYLEISLKRLGVKKPNQIKGVKGMISKRKIPELLDKGILRAIYRLNVNKDGTIRFDAVEGPITHFKPKEIGISIEKLKEMGYTHDIYGNPLERDDQILELKPHDVILPDPPLDENKSAANVLLRVSKFIDDLLEKVYGLERYYNAKTKEDLVGHIVFVLAPHTSAAVAARIIGFSKTQVLFAHPAIHAAVRRNCDGDEASIMLGLDAFINFSKQYLPSKRGGLMDAPLAITVNMELEGIDDEALDLDVTPYYPLELYEKSWNLVDPTEINIDRLEKRVGKIDEWFDHWFTLDNGDINEGNLVSSYKKINDMKLKISKMLELANKIRAVDENRVAEIVVNGHLLKDIKGNLRKFGVQSFRCIKCNEKYRRWPLTNKCPKCGGDLVLTVSEGFVLKYLFFVSKLVREYKVDPYIKQSVELIEKRVIQLFGKDKLKTTKNLFSYQS